MPVFMDDNLTKTISVDAEAGLPHFSACAAVSFFMLHCLDK